MVIQIHLSLARMLFSRRKDTGIFHFTPIWLGQSE